MNFPTLNQVKNKASKTLRPLHNYPYTFTEEKKVDSYLKTGVPFPPIDTRQSFRKVLDSFDNIFGKYVQTIEEDIVIRGKVEYKGKIKDPLTGENQVVYTISNPKCLYRPLDSGLYFIRVPEKSNLFSGFYAQIVIHPKNQPIADIFFVNSDDIHIINFEVNVPTIFLDYDKFTDAFKTYGFDMSENSQKYKRNLELTNLDLLLINKIAGENVHNDIKGGVNGNIIKTSHDQGMYNLEVLDTFLDTVVFTNKSNGIFNKNLIRSGTVSDFETTLNKNNRVMNLSKYRNFYGCNIGFSMNKMAHLQEDKFIDLLNNSSIDYLNPIGKITTGSRSSVERLLKINADYIFGSQILFLENQLLPIKAKISDISSEDPKTVRVAAMLKKFEGCLNNLSKDEIIPKLDVTATDLKNASSFLKDNRKDVEDFITHKGF